MSHLHFTWVGYGRGREFRKGLFLVFQGVGWKAGQHSDNGWFTVQPLNACIMYVKCIHIEYINKKRNKILYLTVAPLAAMIDECRNRPNKKINPPKIFQLDKTSMKF